MEKDWTAWRHFCCNSYRISSCLERHVPIRTFSGDGECRFGRIGYVLPEACSVVSLGRRLLRHLSLF